MWFTLVNPSEETSTITMLKPLYKKTFYFEVMTLDVYSRCSIYWGNDKVQCVFLVYCELLIPLAVLLPLLNIILLPTVHEDTVCFTHIFNIFNQFLPVAPISSSTLHTSILKMLSYVTIWSGTTTVYRLTLIWCWMWWPKCFFLLRWHFQLAEWEVWFARFLFLVGVFHCMITAQTHRKGGQAKIHTLKAT